MFPTQPKTFSRTIAANDRKKLSGSDASKIGPAPDRGILKLCLPYSGETSENLPLDLFPIVECPRYFYLTETHFQNEAEVKAACAVPGPVPFLLRHNQLYTFEPVCSHSALGQAVKMEATILQSSFADLLGKPEYAPTAIELLDRMLRYHAWKRGLRYDETHRVFYFTRSKPKTVIWEIDGRKIQQEVTAPRMVYAEIERGVLAEAQFGWRHQAIRAGFVQFRGALFLRLQPDSFITELDGKTPATVMATGPIDSASADRGRNPEIVRLLQFWSAVLTKGHRELRIPVGRNPIRVRLTRIAAFTPRGSTQAQMDSVAWVDAGNERKISELIPVRS